MISRYRLSALVVAVAALASVAMPAQAQHYRGGGGYHHSYRGGFWGPGLFLGGLGLGVALSSRPYDDSYYRAPYGYGYGYSNAPTYVVAAPPVVVYDSGPAVQLSSQPVPAARSSAPEPVVYPRNGQSAGQTEADRQACNRWATSQPAAMNDASVFQRATLACLDGRGYTVR